MRSLHRLTRAISAARSSAHVASSACRFEKLEPRLLLSADLLGGAVATDLSQSNDSNFDDALENQQDLDQLVAPFVSSLSRDQAGDTQASLPGSLDLAGLDNYFDREPASSIESANTDVFAEGYAALLSDAANDELRQEIIFIDAATPDYEQLVEGIATDTTQTQFLLFILDGERDGVEQISEVLGDYTGVDAIHLVSHGSEGQVSLGNGSLNTANVKDYSAALGSWQNALDGDADLLIYGCNLAGNAQGQDLLEALALLTGADIAASDDATGNAELGGDWDLEYHQGTIESGIAFNQQTQQQWQGTLATFFVDTLDDTLDILPGDGLALDGVGATSLRAAIMEANALPGADTIVLGAGTYTLIEGGAGENAAAEGDLDITSDITIQGADADTSIIDGGGIDRVFEVRGSTGHLTLSDVTVQGGAVVGDDGGGIYVNHALADLTLNRVKITGNQSADGAGIYVRGTADLTDVDISGNTSNGGATGQGGGVYIWNSATLTNTTISGNSAGLGGGIFNFSLLDLTNVTVSGNTATGAEGGGIYNDAIATLKNVTVAGNDSQTQGGGIFNTSTVNISNTVVANNTSIGGSGHDVSGTFTSDGSNVIEDMGVATGFGSDTTGDPSLGALADNGGFTQTHALLAGSIAIDAGTDTGAPANDQRGVARFGTTDVGAYEYTISAAYEPFSYSAGSLEGLNGGTGWANGWTIVTNGDPGTSAVVNATGLASPTGTLPVQGGTAEMNSSSQFSQSRDLETGLGADGTTAWFSFLLKADVDSGEGISLELGDASDDKVTIGTVNDDFIITKNRSTTGASWIFNTITDGDTYLMTVKVDFAAGNDTVTLYVDPTPGLASPDSVTTAQLTSADLGDFTQVAVMGAGAANTSSIDEIRVGASFADVTPALVETDSLWMSFELSATYDNGTAGDAPDIVAFTDPDLRLELGDGSSGSPTDGTFTTKHTLDENVRALHHVNTDVTVDTYIGGVAGTYDLQAGQIVVSMRATPATDFDVLTVGAGTITVDGSDVLVYTPGTGEYEFLLEDAILKPDLSPANIHAISIVEQQTTIGVDTTLAAGTYLVARSDPGVHSDISTYDNTNGLQDLLLGVDFLSAAEQVQGIELLEASQDLGGITLDAGTLLVTFKSALNVGSSGGTIVSAEEVDVVALTVNATEQDSVSPDTNVDAQIFFDGSDIALTASGINGLTLLQSFTPPVDLDPVFTATGSFDLDENSALDTVVGDVDANDGDGGAADAGVTYDITGNVDPDGDGNNAFKIDALTGVISVNDAGDLDFEGTNPLVITVEADDGVKQATSGVTINLNNINEAPTVSVPTAIFINEIHYDNIGADTGEAIEIAGVAGNDLNGWTLVLYNGFDGSVYDTVILSGTIPNQADNFGTLAFNFPADGIQDATAGNPDGVALIDPTGTVVQFLSYEGAFTATAGPANGMLSTDIGVAEDNGSTLVGDSLQLTGSGATFTWTTPAASNFGAINTGQDFAAIAAATSQTIDEDTSLVFSSGNGNAITVDDVDAYLGAAADPVSVKLDVSNGTLTLGSTTGLGAVLGDGTNSISFTGTIAELNAALEDLIYQPDPQFSGSDTLGVLVDDLGNAGAGTNLLANGAVYITIDPVNDAPTVNATASDTGAEDTDQVYTHAQLLTLIGAADVDDVDAALSVAITNVVNGAVVLTGGTGGAGTTFTFSPTGGFVGNMTFDYQVSDDEVPTPASSAVGTATVALSAVNDAPTVNATASDTGTEDTDQVYTHAQMLTLVGAADVDDVDANLSIAITNVVNGSVALSGGTGGAGTTFTFTPTGDFAGNMTFDYQVSDDDSPTPASSAMGTATVALSAVNDAPTVNATASDTGTEDTDQVYTHAQMLTLVGAADVDDVDANLSIAITNILNGSIALSGGTGGAGTTFTFTPTGGFVGNMTFDYQVSDDEAPTPAASAVGTATVALSAANDAPTVNATASDTGTEDTDQVYTHAQMLTLIGAADVDDVDANLSIAITNILNGSIALSGGTGGAGTTFTFTPTGDFVGNMTFDYQVSDDEAPTPASSAVGSATVALSAVNDAPTVNATASDTGTEDTDQVYTHAQMLTLTGAADVDDVDADLSVAITNVINGSVVLTGGTGGAGTTFTFTPTGGFIGNMTFDYQVSDDEAPTPASSAVGSATVALSAVNDAPTVSATASDTGTEDTDQVYTHAQMLTLIGAADVDDADAALRVAITNVVNGSIALSGGTGGAGTTFSFTPTGDFVGNMTFDYQVSDDEAPTPASSAVGSATVALSAVNDAPTVNATASDTGTEDTDQVYTHAQMLTLIGAADVDDGDANLSIAITNILNGSIALSGGTGGAGTTFTFTPTGGFIGNMTFDYQVSDDEAPTPASSVVGLATVALSVVNDAPTVNATASDTGTEDADQVYTHAQMLTLIGAADVDDADANLSIAITNVVNGSIALSGGTGGAGTTFSFTPTGDFVGNMTFDYQVSDDAAPTPATSAVGTATVALSAVNDDPTLDNAIGDQTADEDTLFNFTFAANSFGDIDVGDTLTYTAQLSGGGALPTWLDFDGATRTFSGTPLNGDAGTISLQVIADDSNGGTVATDTFNIVVANANDDPTLDNAIVDQAATEDSPFTFTFAANTFGDADTGDTLAYTSDASGWLSFNAATRTFSGTPLKGDVGTTTVTVTADDGNGGTPATDTFNVAVANSNDDPTLVSPIGNQATTDATPFSFTFAANTFGDVDVGDTLTYTAQLSGGGALPTWLGFDGLTRTFSGTPLNGDVGTIAVQVVADDGNGGTPATDSFDIVVLDANDDPTLDNAIGDQAATEDSPFSFTFAANTFGDADAGDTLAYTAQLADGAVLPSWLGFDGLTRTFSGTPLNGDVGIITVEVTADDGKGGTPASGTFDIAISNENDAPTGPVIISGTLAANETLMATVSLADEDGLGALNYQWQRDGANIAGATGSSYTLTGADAGTDISLVVSYTDARGTAESVTSNILTYVAPPGAELPPETTTQTTTEPANEADNPAPVAEQPEVDIDPEPDTTDLIETTTTDAAEPEVTVLENGNNDTVQQVSGEIDRKDDSSDLLPELNDPLSQQPKPLVSLVTLQADFTLYNDPLVLVNFQGFSNGIDQLRDEVADSRNAHSKFVGSTFAVSAGISAGYVAWLARSGAILSSVLSALPAWRFIDPLPVLTRSTDGSGDEESLQSLIDDSAVEVENTTEQEVDVPTDDPADNPEGRN